VREIERDSERKRERTENLSLAPLTPSLLIKVKWKGRVSVSEKLTVRVRLRDTVEG
jgi:hypothetical protein